MKITKSQLKKILKEEIVGEQKGSAVQRMKDLYDEWKPSSDEGQKYKLDLGNLIADLDTQWGDDDEDGPTLGGTDFAALDYEGPITAPNR
jgi:hypothetical protein